MTKRFGEVKDFVASSIAAATAAAISTEISLVNTGFVLINPVLAGTITSTSITISIGILDDNDVIAWSAPLVSSIRTLPGAGGKVADFVGFDTYRAKSIFIALESAITGGGTVTLMYASAVPTL
jgi:hypothetical protein